MSLGFFSLDALKKARFVPPVPLNDGELGWRQCLRVTGWGAHWHAGLLKLFTRSHRLESRLSSSQELRPSERGGGVWEGPPSPLRFCAVERYASSAHVYSAEVRRQWLLSSVSGLRCLCSEIALFSPPRRFPADHLCSFSPLPVIV